MLSALETPFQLMLTLISFELTDNISLLQMRKLELTEINEFAQVHAATKWWRWDLKSGLSDAKIHTPPTLT